METSQYSQLLQIESNHEKPGCPLYLAQVFCILSNQFEIFGFGLLSEIDVSYQFLLFDLIEFYHTQNGLNLLTHLFY